MARMTDEKALKSCAVRGARRVKAENGAQVGVLKGVGDSAEEGSDGWQWQRKKRRSVPTKKERL